ncbi:uncharacterized protein LOC133831706 [Humulus lupulus]|uniref:uncharacterized protein LOC133831706 n=1 Tax=Humulus lupulus TaxID=3486 RepID=UPI002B412552|nr:uncharacterized protein LOC133831706 [Humulus lupulus]
MKQPEAQPNVLNQFMTEKRASIRNSETQIGQLANLMTNCAQGNIPSTTEVNPKEQCNAISLRSGKELEEPSKKPIQLAKVVNEKRAMHQHFFCQSTLIDVELFEVYERNFDKERKLEDYETVALTEECSAIQKKLPPKLKDLGSFNIPFSVGSSMVTKALCDLGASINLMPLSIFQKVDGVESEGNKIKVTKKKSMVEGGKRTVRHKVKRMFSEKARLFHERWKV